MHLEVVKNREIYFSRNFYKIIATWYLPTDNLYMFKDIVLNRTIHKTKIIQLYHLITYIHIFTFVKRTIL